jgi:2-C-methyl-D-erythritol 4-phosphate cytidylyltransferase
MDTQFKRYVVVVAGGSGLRMGKEIPKQFLPLKGKAILVWTVINWLKQADIQGIALVLPVSQFDMWQQVAAEAMLSDGRIHLCEGGTTRTQSVASGLACVQRLANDHPALVAIHDGVRPFVTNPMAEQAFRLAAEHGGAVACVPVKASLRRQVADGRSEAVDRSVYWEVQTPQTFRLPLILSAFHRRPHDQFSDDASLFEWAGGKVAISEGHYGNIKITTPEDLLVAEGLMDQG